MGRVLVVEDDGFTRMLLATTCESLGFDCVAAGSAIEARSAWTDHEDLEAALLDLDLGPGPTGVDLARAFHVERPQVRLIILTSYSDVRLAGNLPTIPPDVTFATKSQVSTPEQLRCILRGTSVPEESPTEVDLTQTQVELLRLVAAGHSNAEIGRLLWLSIPGVEKALSRLAQKLQLPTSSEHNRRVLLVREYYRLSGRGHGPEH
jgi:DNA-binding NarL/FixJ family response regulator